MWSLEIQIRPKGDKMAHNDTVVDLIGHTLKLKRNQREKEQLLEEVYSLSDEYNVFVKNTDKKMDRILSRMEALVEDGH
jgi:hypothetical protein